MKLSDDIRSPWLLHTKGILFLVAGLMAGGLIMLENPTLKVAAFLLITIWSFCRFYYYLFYVLERYLGREKRFAGVFDAVCSLLRSKRRTDKET